VGRTLFIALACVLATLAVGCGEEGVSSGATVTVYVSGESLCKGARQELGGSNGRAGSFRIRMICLDDPGTLAATGANARRATEDSSTVGYLTEPDPTQASFSRSILDAANITQLANVSGAAAMGDLLRAIRQASDESDLRQSVYSVLG
jgi:hypothetical protein